jgi:cytochrome b561
VVKHNYDIISISIHWLIALLTIGLFCLGLWMVDLGYYDDWYYRAPWWHTGLGIVVFALFVMRFWWRFIRKPLPAISMPRWQNLAAKSVHFILEMLLLVIALTGYFMVTAKGDGLSVFDWFVIPAYIKGYAEYVDTAGLIHLWAAYSVIGFASLHALAALKHHFINKDATLLRMIGFNKGETQ